MLSAAVSYPFSFEPMSMSFDPIGAGAVRSFKLKNDAAKRIAVRVQILTRDMALDGSERNEPVPDGLFVVFPSRFVMEPESIRTLKVQWRGGDAGEIERAFRIVAEQVPVALEERKEIGRASWWARVC